MSVPIRGLLVDGERFGLQTVVSPAPRSSPNAPDAPSRAHDQSAWLSGERIPPPKTRVESNARARPNPKRRHVVGVSLAHEYRHRPAGCSHRSPPAWRVVGGSRLWPHGSMQLRHGKTVAPAGDGPCKVTAVAWSPNNCKLAVVTVDRVVVIYDENGQARDKFPTKSAEGSKVRSRPSTSTVARASDHRSPLTVSFAHTMIVRCALPPGVSVLRAQRTTW